MSARERIDRALNCLKLPMQSQGRVIFDATGKHFATLSNLRTMYATDATKDAASLCEIVNSAAELIHEKETT